MKITFRKESEWEIMDTIYIHEKKHSVLFEALKHAALVIWISLFGVAIIYILVYFKVA